MQGPLHMMQEQANSLYEKAMDHEVAKVSTSWLLFRVETKLRDWVYG